MFSCVIIDDDPFASAHIRRLISSRSDLSLNKSFLNPTEALEYLKDHPSDIVFLDIYMPEIMGTTVAKLLGDKTMVIYTTSSKQHALEAFEVNAIDYLLKPVNDERFTMAVNKAVILLNQKQQLISNNPQPSNNLVITIISDRKIYKISSQDILYIESLYEYVCYYTSKGKLLSLGALKDVVDILPENGFIRIHKSHIVNIDHVNNYTAKLVTLSNGVELPIGRVYKQPFKTRIGGI